MVKSDLYIKKTGIAGCLRHLLSNIVVFSVKKQGLLLYIKKACNIEIFLLSMSTVFVYNEIILYFF